MPVAKLNIDKNIGEYDDYAEMFSEPQMCFSSKELQQFFENNPKADEYEITINSNGGSVTQGFTIHDMLIAEKAKGKKITTIAFKANSIATVIFLAGDERKISKNAEFVIHPPAIDVFALDWDVRLTADELQKVSDEVREYENKLWDFYTGVLNLDEAKTTALKSLYTVDTDLGSAKALEYGFATEVIGEATATKLKKALAYTDKIAAIVKQHRINNNMDIKGFKAELTGIKDMLAKAFKSMGFKEDGTKAVEAATTTLEGGTTIYYVEDTLANGIVVYSDEAMTTFAPEGSHTTAEGATFSVNAEGVVSDLTEATAAETDAEKLAAANKKIEDLEKQLNAQKAKVVEAKKQSDTVAAQLVAMKKTVDELSAFVPGDDYNTKKVGGTKREYKDLSAKERVLYNRGELEL